MAVKVAAANLPLVQLQNMPKTTLNYTHYSTSYQLCAKRHASSLTALSLTLNNAVKRFSNELKSMKSMKARTLAHSITEHRTISIASTSIHGVGTDSAPLSSWLPNSKMPMKLIIVNIRFVARSGRVRQLSCLLILRLIFRFIESQKTLLRTK